MERFSGDNDLVILSLNEPVFWFVRMEGIQLKTLNDFFFQAVSYDKDSHVLYPEGGEYRTLSSRELYRQVISLSLALEGLGLKEESRIAVFCKSSYKWAVSDFAILLKGSVTVTVYPNLLPRQIEVILRKSECEALFVGEENQLGDILEMKENLPSLKWIILMEGSAPEVILWDDLIQKGDAMREGKEDDLLRRARARKPEDVATILFTSGTTADPKGVVLTHHNIVSNVLDTSKRFAFSEDDVALVFLPLSHILERMVDFVYWHRGVTIAYAESMEKIGENFMDLHPTIFCSVPRLYEKMYDRVWEAVKDASFVKKIILQYAVKIARRATPYMLKRKPLPVTLRWRHSICDRLCYQKIREKLGGRLEFCIAGGAALNVHVANFFIGAGVYILEGYGLTETSPVLSCNTFEDWKLGTVGKPLDTVIIRISDEGEILAKGPNVFREYYRDPESTREAFTEDGFFKTGDVGTIDEEGFLSITDRKKDLIVTAGGKNIAPLPVEEMYKRSLHVSYAVMVGDARPYPVILLVPDFSALTTWAGETGLDWQERADLLKNEKVLHLYADLMQKYNKELARYEQPKKFALLPEEFTVDNGMLTPTMKVRRRVVLDRYRDIICGLYESSGLP